MKRILPYIATFSLLMTGCRQKTTQTEQDYTGPVQTEETMTAEEKILFMIQQCITDYNEGNVQERRDYYQISIPDLPIDVASMPEINSLDELTEFSLDESSTNVVYQAYYTVSEPYEAVFSIYHPSSSLFWLNADIEFIINPDQVQDNNPEFASTKQTLDSLFADASTILNTLYGIGVTYDENTMTEDGYYVYTPTDGISSIQALKDKAESIYTYEFLSSTYYTTAFEGISPVYKEIDGVLYVSPNEEMTEPYVKEYLTSKIIAVRDNGDTLDIDLLYEYYEVIQSTIQRITLVQTENGYRLNSSL